MAAPLYRPGQELRTVSGGSYEVSVQKNGRLDINLLSGPSTPIVANVLPMVWFDGEEYPEPLELEGRFSERQAVNDRLGEGQGIILRKGNCEWGIRTYTAQPFLVFQAVYVNDTAKPVKIKMLMPVTTDEKTGGVTLGEATQKSIASVRRLGLPWDAPGPRLVRGADAKSWWNVALWNPANGRSLIAGTLTHDRAVTYIELALPTTAAPDKKIWSDARNIGPRFQRFQIANVYDPPVEVPPGGRLESETVYLGVTDESAVKGLERFGQAVAVVQKTTHRKTSSPQGIVLSDEIESNDALMYEAENLSERYTALGWNYAMLGHAWPLNNAPLEAAANIAPENFGSVVESARKQNIHIGLPLNLVTVPADSSIVREHPDWIAPATTNGQIWVGKDRRVLDIGLPEVEQHMRDSIARAVNEWHLDAATPIADLHALWCVERFSNKAFTRVEAIRRVLTLAREALGPDRPIYAGLHMPFIATFADGYMIEKPHGHIADTWYEHPALWHAGGAPIELESFTTNAPAALSEATLRAMLGGPIHLSGVPSHIPRNALESLRKLMPAADRPALPLDYFLQERPQVWVSKTGLTDTFVAAVMNDDASKPKTIRIDFAAMGLNAETYRTVYNLWEDKYYGTAQGGVDVEVAPESHGLFVIAPHRDVPSVLAAGSHVLQSDAGTVKGEWNASSKTLTGVVSAPRPGEYPIRILAPEGMLPTRGVAGAMDIGYMQNDRITTLTVITTQPGDVAWEVSF
ncbi:MAG: hypothetical protein AMXMBFR84_18400 [Candidatus Hydrogenedentota bacterium]